MGDDRNLRNLSPTTLKLGTGLLALAATAVAGLVFSGRASGMDGVVSAVQVGEPGQQQLLLSLYQLHSHEDGHYYRFRLDWLDPATGQSLRSERLEGTAESNNAYGVLAAAGPYYWLEAKDGLSLRDLRDPAAVTRLDALAARHPEILGPWHQDYVLPSGELIIESDDKRLFSLDPRTGQASPLQAAPYRAPEPFAHCAALAWQRPGELLAIVQQPVARYSQKETYALCRIRQLDYGRPIDPVPVSDARIGFAMFACDGPTGQAITFEGPESALISISSEGQYGWARLLPDGTLRWRHLFPKQAEQSPSAGWGRAFRFGERVVVVRGPRLTALAAADGRVLWERSL